MNTLGGYPPFNLKNSTKSNRQKTQIANFRLEMHGITNEIQIHVIKT